MALFPLEPLPHIQHHNPARWAARPGEHLRLRLYYLPGLWRPKKGPNERTDQGSRKTQLSDKEIANLLEAQFKTLVIRMLQELTEYFDSIKKTQAVMKVALCEIKKDL